VTGKSLGRIDPSRAPLSPRTPLVPIGTGMMKIRFAREDAGQTVVLVALMFTVLMGFAALGIDVGRFYSERRYIQDAVDSAALACAYKYAQGGIVSDAAPDLHRMAPLDASPSGSRRFVLDDRRRFGKSTC